MHEPAAELEAAVQMRRLLYGQLVSRALCAVAALDIPNVLGDGALDADALADKTGAHAPSLRRILRALIPFGVFAESGDGRFRLTPLGATLREDAAASALPTAMLVHGAVGESWNRFAWTASTGESAFGQVFGTDFFSLLENEPELRATFHESQFHGLRLDLAGILRTLDLSGCKVLADVGGGDGALLESVLTAYPEMRGILLDLPSVVERAGLRFAAAGLSDRVELCGGDFFRDLPAGADHYLLRQIIHDLDDERSVRLLRACREAMAPDATLLVMDIVTDHRADGGPDAEMSAVMDLYMMAVFGGHERSLAEFERLLGSAGFAVREVTAVSGHMSAIAATPV